jgi:hypothetical protein
MKKLLIFLTVFLLITSSSYAQRRLTGPQRGSNAGAGDSLRSSTTGGSVPVSATAYTQYITANTATFNSITYNACDTVTEDDCTWTEVADTQLDQASAAHNYGASTSVYINKFSAGNWAHVLLKFSGLSNIPATATVTSVTLGYSVGDLSSGSHEFVVTLNRMLVDWTEGTQANDDAVNDTPDSACWTYSTGTTAWGTAGAANDTDRSSTASGTITHSSTGWHTATWTTGQALADVQGWIAGTYSNYGWRLERTDGTNDGHYFSFQSSNNASTSGRVYLKVEYTN